MAIRDAASMTCPKRSYTYRVVHEWSVVHAQYVYAVYRTTHWEDKEDTVSRMGIGDRDWADKNANHFGIEITDDD